MEKCKYCKSKDLVLEPRVKGEDPKTADMVALRCKDCNKWLGWVSKNDRHLYLKNQKIEETSIIEEQIAPKEKIVELKEKIVEPKEEIKVENHSAILIKKNVLEILNRASQRLVTMSYNSSTMPLREVKGLVNGLINEISKL